MWHLLFNVNTNTSRQRMKSFCRGKLIVCVNLEPSPVTTTKTFMGNKCCAPWNHLQTGSLTGETEEQLWCTDKTVCLQLELKQPSPTTPLQSHKYHVDIYDTVWVSLVQTSHLKEKQKTTLPLVQQCNNGCGSQQAFTEAAFTRSLQHLPVRQPGPDCH